MCRTRKPMDQAFDGERGASLVIALTIIFVLSTLGGIALLATASNMRMGSAVADWTSEYYELDKAAEDALAFVDGILMEAERFAYAYMRDELYREGDTAPSMPGDVAVGLGDVAVELSDKAQHYIHNRWLSEVFLPSAIDADGEAIDMEAYDSRFPRFHEEFFQRLYFYCAHRILTRVSSGDANGGLDIAVEMSPSMAGYAGMLDSGAFEEGGMAIGIDVSDPDGGGHAKHVAVRLHVAAPRFGLATEVDDMPFRANPVWTNAVTAKGIVTFAGSSSRVRVVGDVAAQDYNEYYPAFGDFVSLSGNAYGVAVAGAVVDIYGNVYTRGDFHVTESGGMVSVSRYPPGLPVAYKTNAHQNTLFFDTSPMPALIQRYVQLESEEWQRAFIPFFYRDSLGGNVYCNNLAIEAGVVGGSIQVNNGRDARLSGGQDASSAAGVVWTLDDVQNDGASSSIVIDGNLIGLSSEAAFADHMSSSAVVNAGPGSSVIRLGGAAVVPGTAFMRFDGVNDQTGEDVYFETAESVTADEPSIMRAYAEPPVYDAGVPYYFDNYLLRSPHGAASFFLVHYDVMADQARHIIRNLAGRAPATGVVIPGSLEGYARGAVFAQGEAGEPKMFGAPGVAADTGHVPGFEEIANYSQNYMAYSEIRDSLKTAFRSKTEALGTDGRTIERLVDKAAIVDDAGMPKPGLPESFMYIAGDGELRIEGEMHGIVYCAAAVDADADADTGTDEAAKGAADEAAKGAVGADGADNASGMPTLRVTGAGEFYGTIISEGDIVIDGALTIQYDEDAIARTVLMHPQVKAFFAPGEQGAASYVRVVRISQSAQKISSARYILDSWLEWQE